MDNFEQLIIAFGRGDAAADGGRAGQIFDVIDSHLSHQAQLVARPAPAVLLKIRKMLEQNFSLLSKANLLRLFPGLCQG